MILCKVGLHKWRKYIRIEFVAPHLKRADTIFKDDVDDRHRPEPFTKTSLAQKIRWEGGLLATLDYGIQPDEIEDPDLAALWRSLDEAYRQFSPLLEEIAERLDVAA